jgi:hypothetical protein
MTRTLLSWPEMPPVFVGRSGPVVATILGVLGLAAIAAWIGLGTGPSPLLLIGIVGCSS